MLPIIPVITAVAASTPVIKTSAVAIASSLVKGSVYLYTKNQSSQTAIRTAELAAKSTALKTISAASLVGCAIVAGTFLAYKVIKESQTASLNLQAGKEGISANMDMTK